MKIKQNTLGWIICVVAVIFYCYEYILRITPSVMMPELMHAFNADATKLGILASCYYFIYTPMQIVVGLLADLYGPRKILTIAIITCTIGNYLFSFSNVILIAAFGRSLIGFGSAFAFVCILKLTSVWLPQKFFASFVGLATMLSMIGAITQVSILNIAVHNIGWKQTNDIGTIIGLILIPIMWYVIRDYPNRDLHKQTIKYQDIFMDFLKILSQPQIWLNGFIACTMYLSLSLFAELWGILFLSNVYKLDAKNASFACSMIYLGWLIGSPLIGYISDITGSRKIPILIGCFLSTFLSYIIIFPVFNNFYFLCFLLFLFGFFTSFEILCFAISKEKSPQHLVATATAFTNFLIMLGGIIAQPIIGLILDATLVHNSIQDTFHVYSKDNYQSAFILLPLSLAFGFIAALRLKETNTLHSK